MDAVSFVPYLVVGAVLAGAVLNDPLPAVGLEESVHSLGFLSIPVLPLVLDVVGVVVVDVVVVVVMGPRSVIDVLLQVVVVAESFLAGNRHYC